MAIVAEIARLGPFFAGDTGPPVEIILLWDSGGYVQIQNASITVNIHRWDPRRKLPVGPIVTTGDAAIKNFASGEVTFDWQNASPVGTVPLDSGHYMLQADVTFADGTEQLTQRAVFEVLPV